jgi:hypothetical protein
MGGLLPSVAERRLLTGTELSLYEQTTEAQANRGVTLDEMLQAWHIGFDVLRRWAQDRIAEQRLRSQVLLEFLDLIVPWMDSGVTISVECYRAAARLALWHDGEERAQFVRRVLDGAGDRDELKARSRAYGIDPNRSYRALRVPHADEATVEKLVSWLGLRAGAERPSGVVALVDGDAWGFVSELPERPADLLVGISSPTPLDELRSAFRFATRAMDTAAALELSGCHDVKSLGVHPAVLADDDVGAELVARYVEPVEALGQTGGEILKTVRAFLDHHGHHERTAAELFVHVNTVRYRIRRFEQVTGTSLRETASVVAVWWALERRRLRPRSS